MIDKIRCLVRILAQIIQHGRNFRTCSPYDEFKKRVLKSLNDEKPTHGDVVTMELRDHKVRS